MNLSKFQFEKRDEDTISKNMNKFIINPDALYKNVYIAETGIKAADEDRQTLDAFLAKFNEKEGFLSLNQQFEYRNLGRIIEFDEENALQFTYKKDGEDETFAIALASPAEKQEVLNFILSKTDLTAAEIKTGGIGGWIKQALYTLVAAILSTALIVTAVSQADGEDVRATGSRRGLKRLLLSLTETLGVTGTLTVGILVTAALAFWTFKAYKNSQITRRIYQKTVN